jgi:Tfp pilus assembly protein FimT
MVIQKTISINQIRSAIVELSARAQLARSEGRPQDGAELERRAQAYRDELGRRP